MPTLAEALVVLFLLSPGVSARAESNHEYAQAGEEENVHSEYKQRMDAAKTPEDKARIQQEYDRRLKQESATPETKEPTQTVPGTSGSSGSMPKRDRGPQSEPPQK